MSRPAQAAPAAAQAVLADLLELAAIPAPTFAEAARIGWLGRRLARARGTRDVDAVGNLIWRWGSGRPRVLIAAHVDTVFGADTELRIRSDDRRAAGPGVGDNAAAVAAAVHVVEKLIEQDGVAPGAVAFTVGEEGNGNLRGARAAFAELRPELVLALEGHGLGHVIGTGIGSLRARLVVIGPGGHSWSDRGTPSALHALVDLARSLLELSTADAPINLGRCMGGRGINVIADHAELAVEQRALEMATLDGFAAMLERVAVEPPLTVRMAEFARRPAGALGDNAALLGLVAEVRSELGLPASVVAGSTDANAAIPLGIPAVTLGLADGGGMHTLDEWIDVPSLSLGISQLDGVLARILLDRPSGEVEDDTGQSPSEEEA